LALNIPKSKLFMAKIILVRHGETDKNINNSLHASNDPEALNSTGIKQITVTANKLATLSPYKIYSSKERRALESSKIISDIIKIPVEEINGMQERNWGVFTGKPWGEVKKVLDPMSLDERFNYVPQDGESWKTFETRLIEAIKKIFEESPNKTVVVVTHGGAIRALMPFLLNVPKEESFKYDPNNASLTIFDYDGDKYTQVMINDTSHLV
jgi:broad specificity phosphatase PhoE